jgi:ribonuclease HI
LTQKASPLPLFCKLSGALKAIEIASANHWNNLWLETHSMFVVTALKNQNKIVAWPLRNMWKNAMVMIRQMNFMVTHVYREDNKVADLVANFGLMLLCFLLIA